MWKVLLCGAAGAAVGQNVSTSSAPQCKDVKHWQDATGDDCDEYAKEKWCSPSGSPGEGWDSATMGTLAEYKYRGLAAPQACCSCGGGVRPGQAAPAMAEEPAHTLNGCECQKSWTLGDMKCDKFCCNPDNDVGGAWCMVASESCEEADWGYCLDPDHDGDFVDADKNFGLFGYGYVYYGYGFKHGGYGDDDFSEGDDESCVDLKNTDGMAFADEEGYFCRDYRQYTWCTQWGRPDWGWHEEWGTLEAAAKKDGLSAPQACCTCGGGNRSAAAIAAANKSLAATGPDSWLTGPMYFVIPAVLVLVALSIGYCCGRRKDTGLGDGIPTKLGRAGNV